MLLKGRKLVISIRVWHIKIILVDQVYLFDSLVHLLELVSVSSLLIPYFV